MSDKKPDKAPAPAADKPAEGAAPKKKLPIVPIAVVAVVMIVEGLAVYFLFGATGPKSSHAAEHVEVKDTNADKTSEIELVKDRFQNMQGGGQTTFLDVEIYLQVKNKFKPEIERKLEERGAEIKEGITQIFARAQQSQLREPERQSLNRQITHFMRKILEDEHAKSTEPLFERVLIPKCHVFKGVD